MDYELLLRAYLTGDIQYSPYIFSKYRIHPSAKTHLRHKFVQEWREVFLRFLASTSNSRDWIDRFSQAGLYCMPSRKYPFLKDYSKLELDLIVSFHLLACIHMLYQSGNDRECRQHIEFARQFLPIFYQKYGLSNIHMKSILVPSPLRIYLKNLLKR
jgi:hypothetical protein